MESDDEEQLLRSAALQNAKAILVARQRVEDELRRTKAALEDETRILEVLHTTGQALASQLALDSIGQVVTDAATQLSGAEVGAFFYTVKNPSGDVFTLFALSGAPREAFDKLDHPRTTPLLGPTFEGDGIIRSANIKEDPRYGQWAPHHGLPLDHLPVCSYLAVPVRLRSGEVIGGLFFGHQKPDMFTEKSERLVVGIAGQAAVAIDNARLFDEAKKLADSERAARSEIERVSMLKDEFLATLSHELRTPLSAVLGWAELLLGRPSADAETRRGLETIARNARAQTQLIEDLLDMNRIVSGKIRLDVQRLMLENCIEGAIDTIRPSAEAKSIRLRTTLDPNAGPVYGDPHRLQQIVWNLLSNAVKFTPKGGKIDVLLHRVNSHIEIVVSDSGVGVKAEFLPMIFERFRQQDSSTTRRYGGLGLGLSIVKQLVELHGGTIRAESLGDGRGSTFTVALPLRAIREGDNREHPTTGRVPVIRSADIKLANLKALVVDDEPDARELLRSVLAGAGAEVFVAASAEEALALVKSERPDVIISDIGMPDRDGYQFIRAVRAIPAKDGGRTPAVALTAFARSEDRTRALIAGYQVHLSKPIEPHELVVTVASLMGRMNSD